MMVIIYCILPKPEAFVIKRNNIIPFASSSL